MNWFGRSARTQLPPVADFQTLRTDFHSHLLPGIDDGAQTLADSVVLITRLKQLGFSRLITTPHVRTDYFLNEAADIRERQQLFVQLPEVIALGVTIEVAAEYFFDEHFIGLVRRDDLLSFSDRRVLIETSTRQRPLGFTDIIKELRAAGYQPVLAHPERYAYGWEDVSHFEAWRAAGVSLQVNTTAFSGHYGGQIQKAAERLAERGMIDYLGSDCHRLEHIELMEHALRNKHLQQLLSSGVLKNALL
jgi:protein-tyrosine phosphatase